MIQNATIQNSALCMAVAKNFPDGKWELVQNQDEESPLTDEPILLTDEEQAKMDELHAMLDEEDTLFMNLCDAAREGSLADVRHLVETQGVDVNAQDKLGWTPLHHAAAQNPSVDIIKYLISQRAIVNSQDYCGKTPLYRAAEYNSNVDVLKYLIAEGADINVNDMTPLDVVRTEEKKRILREAMGLVPWG